MNLCRPDESKSCAACCGLYNVQDARRSTLRNKLERRTTLFRTVPRLPEDIDNYKTIVRLAEAEVPLEEMIHVCEFVGFLDTDHRVVGCQLHPFAPGNGGVDLRGLCHYGSMACKAFFCPAWTAIPRRHLNILSNALQDWHLYGLVISDVDFVTSLFGLVEARIRERIDATRLGRSEASLMFREMISWKDTWAFESPSPLRRSRYYFKPASPGGEPSREENMKRLLDCLGFTFDAPMNTREAKDAVEQALDRFARAYHCGCG